MPSLKALLRDTVGQLVFKELAIESARDVTPHFRRLKVAGDWLSKAQWSAGDKLQIMIAESGPRTYTPFSRDAVTGSFELLAFVHGDTPTAAWVRHAQPGHAFRAFGPRGSLPLAGLPGPVVFVGDETSFAAAASLRQTRTGHQDLAFVFESSFAEEAAVVLAELGLESSTLVQRQNAHGHLGLLEQAVRKGLTDHPGAQLVLTGHAQTIQGLRARFKALPPAYVGQKSKAYWADGKSGLD